LLRRCCISASSARHPSAAPGRRADGEERVERLWSCHAVEHLAGRAWTDAVEQLQDAEARHAVGRVFGPAQDSEKVLDVGRLDEFEAAELHEGDVAAVQLDLQHGAVTRGAEQDRLLLERNAGLAVFENRGGDVIDLRRVIENRHQRRLAAARAF
jgi:hypothetical protein